MEIAKVSVSGVAATTVEATTIPAGIIGATIAVEYGPEWGGMIKNVSFRGAEDVTVVNVGNVVKLPQEVAAKPNMYIQIGFTGVSGDGTVLIPTLWAYLGTTRPASPVNVEGGSMPPVWAQVVAMIGDLNMLKTPSKDNLVNAINDAADNVEGAAPNSEKKPSMISFIDDDCREATFLELYLAINEAGIPYALACPPGNIGVTEGYMRVDQLQTMYESGVDISCHHWTQTNMNRYESAEAYAEDLDKCLAKFEEWGIRDVSSVCYPQGVYDDAFMKPVRERFKLGFGTFRGINNVPLESYYLRRCELFPKDGSFTIQQAKDMVDRVAAEGGWLIFMTHAWYPTFSKEELLDLISYIKDKKVHIGSIDDGLNTLGNQAEAGAFHKPIESNAEPYFVKDANGQVWSKEYGAVELTLRTAKVISSTGPVVSVSSGDTEYVVSEKLDITGQDTVILSGWASDGNGLYVMYDADGNRKQVRYSTVSYADGGEYMDNMVVPIPDGVTHIAVAGYFRKQMPGVIMRQGRTVTDEQIAQAVEDYLQENPNESGVTIYDDGNGNVSIMSKNPRALAFTSMATGENPVFYRGFVQSVAKAKFTSTAAGTLQEE